MLLVLSRRKVIACTRDARAVVVGGARAADDDGGVRRNGQPSNSANVVSSLSAAGKARASWLVRAATKCH